MNRAHIFAASVAVSSCLVSCDSGDSGVRWVGEEPHLRVRGTLNGEQLDIDLRGAEATAAMISCERQYETTGLASDPTEPDLATAEFDEVTFDIVVAIGGEQRMIELELKKHDLQSDPVGTRVGITPRIDGVDPAPDQMWLEFEWHTVPGDVTYFEEAAQGGTVTVQAFTGTPGSGTAVIPEGDGVIGLTIDARWSPTESLEMSITAPCLTNDINVN